MASDPITSWQIDGEKMETVGDFIFLGSKITVDGDCSHAIKRCFLFGRKAMTNLCCQLIVICTTLCDPMDCSTHSLPVPSYIPELAQIHFHWNGDATQQSHLLSPSSPSAFNLSQHRGLFQWVDCSHQVAKVTNLDSILKSRDVTLPTKAHTVKAMVFPH